jgi:hypothetical protein
MLVRNAPGSPNVSTWTEWSMIRSTGINGLTRVASPPARAIALRIAARSTVAGTPVKSCMRTRYGMKATVEPLAPPAPLAVGASDQRDSADTSSAVTSREPARRRRFSSRIFTVCGRRSSVSPPASASHCRRWMDTVPPAVSSAVRAPLMSSMDPTAFRVLSVPARR